MDIASGRFPAYLKSRAPQHRIFLFHGPDDGLVRELARALSISVLGTLDDPFGYIELDIATLLADPARLADEATALSMMGGERVVRVRGATANSKDLIEPLLALDLQASIVVIEAGDIRKDSALVKMIAAAPQGVSVRCELDKASDIDALIREMLGAAKLTASPEIIDYLRDNLGSDRAVSRRELEKLTLYMQGKSGPLPLADVRAVIGDSSAQSIFDIMNATMGGNVRALEKHLNKAFSAGDSPIGMLRFLQNQLKARHKKAAAGSAASRHLAKCLKITMEAEIGCKSTGYPDEAICRRALMRIAIANRQR